MQLGRRGVRVDADDAQLASLAADFAASHHVRLPQFFADDLLRLITRDLADENFVVAEHGTIARELTLQQTRAVEALHFLMNSKPLFDVVARITGATSITHFSGRIYRMPPASSFYDSWHTDLGSDSQRRLAAISVNVGGTFDGGVLQIRDSTSQRIITEVGNRQHGDAILFRVDPALQHRLTPIEGVTSRTAYAGWFVHMAAPAPLVSGVAGVVQ